MTDTCIISPQIISGAITAALGWGVGYFSAIRISDLNARRNAIAKLRAAFAPAIAMLSLNTDIDKIKAFFEADILHQASAIEEFRPYTNENIEFQEAWNEYIKTINEENSAGIDPETTWLINQTMENGEIVELLPLIKQKIENILHFASP